MESRLLNEVKETASWIQKLLEEFVDLCEKENLTNEQFYIEFEDTMNRLSTKDHNKPVQHNGSAAVL